MTATQTIGTIQQKAEPNINEGVKVPVQSENLERQDSVSKLSSDYKQFSLALMKKQ